MFGWNLFGSRESDDAFHHFHLPEPCLENFPAGLVGITEAMESHSILYFRNVVIIAVARSELAGAHISLAFTSSEKNILVSAALEVSLRNFEMLSLIAISGQLRPMSIPLKVDSHLVLNFGDTCFRIRITSQVGVDGKVPTGNLIVKRGDVSRLRANSLYHAHLVYDPDESRFPIDGFDDAFQRFVRGHRIRTLFSTETGEGIRE